MEIILRATAIYFFLFLVARGVGKRELTQLTAFELILMVTMGDLVQQAVTQEDMSVIGAGLAVGTFAFWILVVAGIAYRFRSTRRVLEGVPVVIVDHGQVISTNLKHERVTVEEVKESARQHGIDDLASVRAAILEPDGRISFITNGSQIDEDEPKAM